MRLLFLLPLTVISSLLYAQTWVSLPDCPRKLDHATGFSIGSDLYIGTGFDSAYTAQTKTNKFYKYNVNTNLWSQTAPLPDSARNSAISFVVGNKAYMGLGFKTKCQYSLYEYDPLLNSWIKKADCPIPYSNGQCSSFTLNGKGYVITGANVSFSSSLVFQYDPITDVWTQMNNFPGLAREDAVAAEVNSKGYFGMGRDWNGGNVMLKDIWEYNDLTDTWTFKTNYPNPGNFWSIAISHKGELFVGCGAQYVSDLIMKYNPVTNIWTNLPNLPSARHAPVGYSYDCNIYICGGYSANGLLNELIKLKVDSICSDPQAGINEFKNIKNIVVSPNPVLNDMFIFLDNTCGDTYLNIVNSIGEVISKDIKLNVDKSRIDVSLLAQGMYFLEIRTKNAVVGKGKFIKN